MKMTDKFFTSISSVYPSSFVKRVTTLIIQGGLKMKPRVYLGLGLLVSVVFSIIAFEASLTVIEPRFAWIAGFIVWGGIEFLFYLLLVATADNRAVKIEEVLPDALQTISANVRAGMTTENAIWMGARPEFGPLEEEIKIVSSKCFGGKPISQALLEMSDRVKSSTLERAVKLLVGGIEMGGEIAPLLEEVAHDIKSTSALKKEVLNATLMYTIFIVFSSVIAAPVLYASSLYYSEMSLSIMKNRVAIPENMPVAIGGSFSSFMKGGGKGPSISPDQISMFSIACIALTTVCGAFILAQIRYGRVTSGLKLVPIFLLCALAIFFVAHSIFMSSFGGMLVK
jgi:hypothetical protein